MENKGLNILKTFCSKYIIACTIQQFNGVDVLLERINEILQPNRNITKVSYRIRKIILNIHNIYTSKLIMKISE